MRCNQHLTGISGSVGVCASCLRDRLLLLVDEQAQAEAQARPLRLDGEDDLKADTQPSPLNFPLSVSPYVCRRGAEFADRNPKFSNQLFYSTPQIRPTGSAVDGNPCKRRRIRFSVFSNLFRSEVKRRDSNSDPSVPAPDATNTSSSSSWFSSIFASIKRKQSRLHSFNEPSTIAGDRKTFHRWDRGMSPARISYSDDEDDCSRGSSGYSSASSPGWRQTPRRTIPTARRDGGGCGLQSRNLTGFSFCLSPLVRGTPVRHWNQKSLPLEKRFPGDKMATPPHLATAASFCANRSRKIADFGRLNRRH